jgi:GntR family transcriptional regulator, trigonelline degradation regulator
MSGLRGSQGESAQAVQDTSLLPNIQRSAAPLRRNVVDALRKAIVEGTLAPGSRLVERELVNMMSVSRTVIREALRQLESEGVVETIPNKGPIVRKLSIAEAKDLYLIRSVLEGLSARMFVMNAGPPELARLRDRLEETCAAYEGDDPETVLTAKNKFYDVLFAGAGSEILSSMIATLHARVWRWRALGLHHPQRSRSRSRESVAGLRALLKAIQTRDADKAEAIARREVTSAASEVMRLLQNEGSEA